MLPPPLAPPLPSRPTRRPRRRIPWLALVGFALVLIAIVGAIGWVGAFSPYGFVRFSLLRAERTITISRPGDYLIFEEGAGATDPRPAAAPGDHRGRRAWAVGAGRVTRRARIQRGALRLPRATERRPGHRSVQRAASRGVSAAGRSLSTRDSIVAANYQSDLPSSLAVGRELGMAWLRTPWGLLVLAGVPLAAGVVVLVVARRRGRREPVAKPPGSPVESVR